jgi:tetratricopeptide (TPR) repeat protein
MGSKSVCRNSSIARQASRLELLADFYESQGKYHEAEQICHRLIELKESALGFESLEIAIDLYNLGLLAYAQDKCEQAEQYLTRCLNIEESNLGPNHPDIAATLDVLAQLFFEQAKYAQAVDACKRAIEISEKVTLTFADVAEFWEMENRSGVETYQLLQFADQDQLICVTASGEA